MRWQRWRQWLTVATSVLLASVAPSYAQQSSQDAPLSEKPGYSAYLNGIAPLRQYNFHDDYDRAKGTVGSLATSGARSRYDRGASIGDSLSNTIHDLSVIMSKFPSCAAFMVVGICVKWKPFPSFRPMVEYFLPLQKVENVDQPLKSGYIVKQIQQQMLRMMSDASSPVGPYLMGPSNSAAVLRQAQGVANSVNQQFFGRPSGLGGVPVPNQGIVDQLLDRSEDERFRHVALPQHGRTYNEYHVGPTGFERILQFLGPFMLPIMCHKRKAVMNWHSDWPGGLLFARTAPLSYLYFPTEMRELYGRPVLGSGAFPYACTGKDMRALRVQDKNNDRDFTIYGDTPGDFLKQSPRNPQWDAFLHGTVGDGCIGDNQGPWVPVVNSVPVLNHVSAAINGTIKGLSIASKAQPQSFYRVLWQEREKYKDKFQISRSDRWRDARGSQCRRIQELYFDYDSAIGSTMNPSDGYEDVIARGDPRSGTDVWHVLIHWKYFRCCPSGYSPFIVWRGDKTQIKD